MYCAILTQAQLKFLITWRKNMLFLIIVMLISHAKIWSLIGLQKLVKVNVLPFSFFRSFLGFGTWKENIVLLKKYFYKNKFWQVVEGRDKEHSDIFSNFTLFRKLTHIKFRANLLRAVDLYKNEQTYYL